MNFDDIKPIASIEVRHTTNEIAFRLREISDIIISKTNHPWYAQFAIEGAELLLEPGKAPLPSIKRLRRLIHLYEEVYTGYSPEIKLGRLLYDLKQLVQ